MLVKALYNLLININETICHTNYNQRGRGIDIAIYVH